MTGYEKFQQKVKDGILAYMPKEYRGSEVDIIHVRRNNDQEQAGRTINRNGRTASARIYLEEYYNRFPDWVSDEAILRTIAGDYLAEESEMEWKAEMAESIKDFDSIKGNIRVLVVNKDMNRESLQDCPKKEVEGTDLMTAFRIMLYKEGEMNASVPVTDIIMKGWDMDVDSLYETALKNTAAQAPAQINSMMAMFFDGLEPLELKEVFRNDGLYILSNPQKKYGAAAMLYPGLLQSIAEAAHSSFYILPSSIHEVLLMKEGNGMDAKQLQRMVMDINQNEVAPQEVLSNQVYFYDGKEQKISLALSPEETRGLAGNMGMASAGHGGMEPESMEEEMER